MAFDKHTMGDEAFHLLKFNVGIGIRGEDGVFHEIKRPPPPILEKCIFCEEAFDINNLHPGHEKCFGKHPRLCRQCGFCFRSYGKIWSRDLEERILRAKARAGFPRECFMCGNDYNLLGCFYQHVCYRYSNTLEMQLLGNGFEGRSWPIANGIDFLYPNLYLNICLKCLRRLFSPHIEVDYDDQLLAVRELGDKLGKLPQRDFPSYIYYYHDKESIEWFLKLLGRLPDPDLINSRFGSFFQLLLKSGLLPEGSRRMQLGTWVTAKDGDLCFSLAERAIDDWLYKKGIAHKKEVKYPDSDMRCDWEILNRGKRIFIEYFGLMNIATYKEKAALKKKIASDNGITLIDIMPECDWEEILSKALL